MQDAYDFELGLEDKARAGTTDLLKMQSGDEAEQYKRFSGDREAAAEQNLDRARIAVSRENSIRAANGKPVIEGFLFPDGSIKYMEATAGASLPPGVLPLSMIPRGGANVRYSGADLVNAAKEAQDPNFWTNLNAAQNYFKTGAIPSNANANLLPGVTDRLSAY